MQVAQHLTYVMYGLLRPRPWMRAFAFDEGHGLSVVGDLPRPDNAGSTGKADRFKVAEQVEHAVTPGSPLTEDYAVQTMYRRVGSAFQGTSFDGDMARAFQTAGVPRS